MSQQEGKFKTFAEFYPFYLQEHSNPVCRMLHYLGSILVLIVLYHSISTGQLINLWLLPVIGYGFAWVGHFFVEKNKPATFKYPFWSFIGDHKMYLEILQGKHKIF